MSPLDHFYLGPDRQWYLSFQHYQVKRINDLAASIDQLDAIGSQNSPKRAKLWTEYERLHDELVADGRFIFDDMTGMWHVEEGSFDGADLPRSNGWQPSPFTWDDGLPDAEEPAKHVCKDFVNVGFQFDKWVCKECGAERK